MITREWMHPLISPQRKRIPDNKSNLQNTSRYSAEKIGEVDANAQRTGEEHYAITWDRQGTVLPVEAGRRGGGCEVNRDRQREEETPEKDNQGDDRDLDTGCGRQGGPSGRGKVGTESARNFFEPLTLAWEGSADKRWQPEGGGTVQVDGHSMTG